MTKFAIYDKKLGDEDRKAAGFFAGDYVYRKNSWTRFFVVIGCALATLLRLAYTVFVDKVDVFALDHRQEAVRTAVFVVVVLVVYTAFGTARALGQYRQSALRMNNYMLLLNKLDRMSMNTEQQYSDVREASYNGANVARARNRD